MEEIKVLNDQEITNSRFNFSLVPLIVLTLLSCYFTVLFLSFDLFHPFSCILDPILALVHYSSWLYVIILSGMSIIIAYFHSCCYTLSPFIFYNRIAILKHIFNPSNFLKMVFNGVYSAVAVMCIFGIVNDKLPSDYTSLTSTVESSKHRLNSHHIFVIMYGFYVGAALSVYYIIRDVRYVQFPMIHQRKFTMLKLMVQIAIKRSLKEIISQMHIFYILFYFSASSIESTFCHLLGIDQVPTSLSMIKNLIDPHLFFITFVTGSFVHFMWSSCIGVVNIFMTEPTKFEVQGTFQKPSQNLLQDVLSKKEANLLQYLGFQNFCKISVEKRKMIFSLSQPGGHPVIWNSISSTFLAIIGKLNDEIGTSQFPTESKVLNKDGQKSNTQEAAKISQALKMFPVNYFKSVIDYLKSKALISYFTRAFPRYSIHKSFALCQPVIWMIEGMSCLIVNSYTEDNFGVVQQKLPIIITALLDLYQVLELQQKSGLFSRRKTDYPTEIKLALKLKQTLHSSLWKIISVFGEDLLSVINDQQHRRLIQNWLNLKS